MGKEKQKAMIAAFIALGIVIAFVIAIVGGVNGFNARPLDSTVTVDGIRNGVQTHSGTIFAKVNDSYYGIDPSDEFSARFQFDAWQLVSTEPNGEPIISLRLAELWIAEFYHDGVVAVHNGYALKKHYKASVCYSVPSVVVQDMVAYIENNGTPHQLGDGTISKSTFYY